MAKKKQKVNHEIKNNFKQYSDLVSDRKTMQTGVFNLEEKNSNPYWKYKDINTIHKTLPDTISFYVESKLNNNQNFKFGLKSKDLSEIPFFRFDSDGATHQNRDEDFGLEAVLTPHFQKFTKNGICIAYQTEEIKDILICKTLKKDINLCIVHFCHESNTRYLEDDFLQVKTNYAELNLFFTDEEEDPLKGLFTRNE